MVTPWQDARPDPPDLPSNEVTCTCSIETRCRDDYLPHVALNLTWFSDTGELSNPVNLGALASETWQKEGEPEPIETDPKPEEPSADGDDAVPDQKHFIERRRFEITSGPITATSDFVRKLSVQAVLIQGCYPNPTKPLPEPGSLSSGSPPGTAGKKDKKDPKKDKKKDQTETEAEVDDSYVKVDILVPLAPLIVQRCEGETGPSITQDVLLQVPCPGLFELKVSVHCGGPLLSAEIRQHLNPLLITLGGVHRLPKEQHLSQQEKVYAVLEAFGERRRTVPMSINAQQNVPFQAHLVYFVGTWPQHETREYLQLARLKVEVHDRDKAGTLPPIEEPPPVVPPTPDTKDAKKKPQDKAPPGKKGSPAPEIVVPTIPPGWEMSENNRHVQEMWHGISSFTIADLLNPSLNHTLNLRSDIEPKRSKASQLGGGQNLQVSQLLNNGEESRKLLASVEKAEFQHMPRYFDGSWVRLSATLAQPMAGLEAGTLETPREALADESADKEDSIEQPSTARYERFARLVVVVDYRKTTVVKQLLQTVQQHNAEAMQLDIGQARAIATVKLDDEQKKLDLDILTGFIVMDRRTRIIVVECLRDGKALQRLLEVLPEENTSRLKVMFNPELGFSKRLYVDFNLVLKQVKLRQTLHSLTQRPDLCLPSKCDVAVSHGLNQLMDMRRAERIHVLKLMNSFPSAVCIEDIETQYGAFVNEKELHGGCMDDKEDARSAHSKMRPRSERSGRSGRSGPSEKSGGGSLQEIEPEEQEYSDHDDEGSMTEEVKVRNAKIVMKPSLDTANPMYERFLEIRKNEIRDVPVENKKAVKELSAAMKAVASPRKVGPRKEVDRTFLAESEVHIYSGQAKNSAELQKRVLREKMQDQGKLWTYSAERNSGCFPLLDKDIPLDRMLRQEVSQDDGRKPFKYPSPREAADYRRMPNNVSDSRKEDLQTPWVENQMHPELKMKEIVTGAFDAQSLGIGGAHVIALRQPALFEAAAPMESEEKIPQMKFQARNVMSIENAVDKHQRTILDGEPKKLGVRFDERQPMRSIRQKYGERRTETQLEVKTPPISFRSDEEYREDKGTYESISDFMNAVRRPLKKAQQGSDWNHSQHLNSMQNKTNCLKSSQARAWQAVTSKPERLISYQNPPSSARSWSKDWKSTLPWDKMRQVSWKPSSELTPLAPAPMSARWAALVGAMICFISLTFAIKNGPCTLALASSHMESTADWKLLNVLWIFRERIFSLQGHFAGEQIGKNTQHRSQTKPSWCI